MKKMIALLFISTIIAMVFSQEKITVDINGNGDYTSIQAAIDDIRAFKPGERATIYIKNGVYKEKLIIPTHICNLHIIGENTEQTVITFDDHAKKNDMGTFKSYTMIIRGNDIILENLTVENNAEPIAQAVALHLEGDRIVLLNCRLLGNQDTLYTGREGSRHYFEDCHIEGTTDFIFGPSTCWFEKCELRCKKNSYITAASTPEQIAYGYIFNNCAVALDENVDKMFLGRPWRQYAMTLFMNCSLPEGIRPEGWDNWRNSDNEKTARYMEYNNNGEGSNTSQRVSWSKQLTSIEAAKYTLKNVMKGCDNWFPACVTKRQIP